MLDVDSSKVVTSSIVCATRATSTINVYTFHDANYASTKAYASVPLPVEAEEAKTQTGQYVHNQDRGKHELTQSRQ